MAAPVGQASTVRLVRPLAVNFEVTGGYNTGAGGFSGTVAGTLDGSASSGTFVGTLTANLANGCVAKRNYRGALTTAALNWTPGDQIETCGDASPLTFSVAPPAVPTPATTSVPTSTTSVSTTTAASSTTTIPPTTTTSSAPLSTTRVHRIGNV